MKKNKKKLLMISVLLGSVVLTLTIMAMNTKLFQGLNLIMVVLIVVIGAIALFSAVRKEKEERQGLTVEDELSTLMKYKSGYYAYLASMYMWLFIFLFKDKFPDTETLLGGGILLSGLIAFVAKYFVKQKFNKQ